jgi:hypothetical protein
MGNLNIGDVSKVIVGPVKLMTAPKGTSLPAFTGDTITWPSGWVNPGYTEDGLTMGYQPTVVEVLVDEEPSPIYELLDKEKATVAAKMSQGTLDNLKLAISGGTLSVTAAGVGQVALQRLDVGGGTLQEVMVGFEGLSPAGFWRVMVAYRANVKANLALAFKRTGKMIIPVEFDLLSDSTKDPGKRLFAYVDKTGPATS